MVRTEFEIRLIFDATRPLPAHERDILLETLGKLSQLRLSRGIMGTDLVELERAVKAMPIAEHAEPSEALSLRRPPVQEAEQIRRALAATTTIAQAAAVLGTSTRTLKRKMQEYGIRSPRKKETT